MNKGPRFASLILATILWTGLSVASSSAQWAPYGPGPRAQHTSVYDSATDQMIVFGGTDLGSINYNDVWVNLNVITSTCTPTCELQWKFETPAGTPPSARSGHSAVYDSVNSRMTVFGGAQGFSSPCANDVWVLENANGAGGMPSWNPLSPGGALPPARTGHSAAYDPVNNVLIIVGGSDCNGGYLGDVWVMNNANGLGGPPKWKQLAPAGAVPPGRAYAAVAYNSSTNSLVLYGGTNGTELADVWVLVGANGTKKVSSWSKKSPAGTAPSPRHGTASGYDAANDRLIINSGFSTTGILGDTWVLSNATGAGGTPTWTALSPTHVGSDVYFHSGIYDPVSNEFVVFGGISARAPVSTTADDHMFVLSGANGLARSK